ncbi:MAG: hypothetical protein K2X82_06590 [Gemmataceae bacterium]|nr:hypothetical protein [Gemmataceae bacterium]
MADGRDHPQSTGISFRATFPWMDIFRCFQIALDPRKLLVAAAGILLTSVGWYVLSAVFYYPAPQRNESRYDNKTLMSENEGKPDYTEARAKEDADRKFAADTRQWEVLADLAGPYPSKAGDPPVGRYRAWPWDEYRGPNPYTFVTTLLSAPPTTWWESATGYLGTVAPVLLEPLVKLLAPVAKMVAPGVSPQTRVYLFLLVLWGVAVWAFAGGVITRLAAVQLANKGPISLRQAVRFVATRYLNYVLSPLAPLAIVAGAALGLAVYGLLALIPVVGDVVLLGLLLPVVLLGGAAMAVFLVGLVGYPLMYPTLSAEGDSSDPLDALSRSVNYVYQAPWHYLWYWLVAVVYGAAVTFFVLFFTSLMVYVGKWAVSIPASLVWQDRKPDYLFIYAPESFGWRELLLQGSPYATKADPGVSPTGRPVYAYSPVNEDQYREARGQFYAYNAWGAGLVAFWLALAFLMMLGFSYSFFWSAATAIYLRMRQKIDEADPDEVFLEEDEPEAPLAPTKAEVAGGAAPPLQTTLPVIVPPPAVPPPPPVAAVPPPPVVASPPPAVVPTAPNSTTVIGPATSPPPASHTVIPPKPDGDEPA